jgi:putative phosphoesterase
MRKIGILSDTHGTMPEDLFDFFKDCDELWHAGDWGNPDLAQKLITFKPLRGVFGNIDGQLIRSTYPEVDIFTCEEMTICMLHIGGYPGRYSPLFKEILKKQRIHIMVCGHSHILKVMYDIKNQLLHLNPGAAGQIGFHQKITAMRLIINGNKPGNLEVWERDRATIIKNHLT